MNDRIDLSALPLRALLDAVADRDLANELLARVRRARDGGARYVAKIRGVVADLYGIEPSDIAGPRRHARLVIPRSIAMQLAREHGLSLPQIGRAFNRDHTTVLHACRKIAKLEAEDLQVAMSLCLLRERLRRLS